MSIDDQSAAHEAPLDPALPLIDAHHHLFAKASPGIAKIFGRHRYLIDDYLADMAGHTLIGSVYIEAHTAYRADGPREMATVGEVEFANGQAALSASGDFGPSRVAAAIVGTMDFRIGSKTGDVLDAMIRAGGGRFRGIRQNGAWDADQSIINFAIPNPPGLYLDAEFRRGFGQLADRALTFDAFVLHPQIDDVTSLAMAFPDTPIVLNHVGNILGLNGYAGRRAELVEDWKASIAALAQCKNVYVKLGGLGNFLPCFDSFRATPPFRSDKLAEEWQPYIDFAIDAFGASRCMFETNYPVDSFAGSINMIINAYKRITAGRSAEERHYIFFKTACDFYAMGLDACK